jgi:hypothetical protein
MRTTASSLLLLGLAACRPDFGLPVSVVTEPRILAVVAAPPEARPGDSVRLTAWPVSEAGPLAAPLDFGFCTSPRPLVESNIVNGDCLGAGGAVTAIAGGVQETDAVLPLDGCLSFGPDTPPQQPGQPPFRSRDPDVTGGYGQPVRVALGAVEAVALVRLRCNLPGASAQAAVEFARRYVANANPAFGAIALEVDGGVVAPESVPPGAEVTLRVRWSADQVETYVVHDRADDSLTERRESFRVSWFTTAGVIPVVTTGRAEDDLGTDTSTAWQTPDAGSGTLWAVLRDSRGGAAVQVLQFTVRQ